MVGPALPSLPRGNRLGPDAFRTVEIFGFDREDKAEERRLHLVPVLRTPVNFLVRIGIEGVVRRVVVVNDGDDPGALGEDDGLRQIVSQLPVEVELRFEDGLFFAGWIDQANFEILAVRRWAWGWM